MDSDPTARIHCVFQWILNSLSSHIDFGVQANFLVFFFQAEDGIRDLRMSRGLGDVYKRQGDYEMQEAECV